MTVPDFQKLCQTCEGILQDGLERPERIAFPTLHPLGPHPSQLEKYLDPCPGGFRWPGKLALISALKMFAGLMEPKSISGFCAQAKLRKIDHLVVSHEIGVSHGEREFYFGQIPRFLEKQGSRVLIAKINHLGWRKWRKPFLTSPSGARLRSFVLPEWGSFALEGALPGKVWQELGRLRKEIPPRFPATLIRQAIESPSSKTGAVRNLRLYYLFRDLIAILKPSSVFFTWEGHAWERLLIRAAREQNLNITCVGYQHTVLFPHAAGPFRSLGKSHDPDEIWTVGVANEVSLKKAWKKSGVKVVRYGSPRYRKHFSRDFQNQKNLCVVAPEGILKEAVGLFSFGKQLASRAPHLSFIFRNHPLLPYSEVARTVPELRDLPMNIRVCDGKETASLPQAKWFLYRGTSLVFEALEAGVRPLYFHQKKDISIDPLEKLRFWKKKVSTPAGALQFMKKDSQQDRQNRARKQKAAQDWGRQYFIPENTSLLRRFHRKQTKEKKKI